MKKNAWLFLAVLAGLAMSCFVRPVEATTEKCQAWLGIWTFYYVDNEFKPIHGAQPVRFTSVCDQGEACMVGDFNCIAYGTRLSDGKPVTIVDHVSDAGNVYYYEVADPGPSDTGIPIPNISRNNDSFVATTPNDFNLVSGAADRDCVDNDMDGYGDNCTAGPDCDDTQVVYYDGDNDSYGVRPPVPNCLDPRGFRYVDNRGDCDDTVSGPRLRVYFFDYDGDGYGVSAGSDCTAPVVRCTPPENSPYYSELSGDCNDFSALVNPGATETCGPVMDRNCDGLNNNVYTFYRDADGDTYGTPNNRTGSCDNATPPHGFVDISDDCEDTNVAIHPGVTDNSCDGIDDNCNDLTDEGYVPVTSCFLPGACAAGNEASSCAAGGIETACATGIPTDEVCNGIDDDCDGVIDNGLAFKYYYPDNDSDGYGNPDNATRIFACEQPAGYVDNSTAFDCNDNISTINPGATDTSCDGTDQNCDGTADEGYVSDNSCGIGYCQAHNTPSSCSDGEETPCAPGTQLAGTDTTCDGVDDDCSGAADEDYVVDNTCGVGYCQTHNTPSSCSGGSETLCAAGSPLAGTDTTCDGVDDDCNGQTDEDYVVNNTCGVGECRTNNTPSSCSGGIETFCTAGTPASDANCNGKDDDCDGQTDEAFVGTQTFCGDGACVRTGISTCSGGITGDTCTPGTPAARDAICDGRDADCDNQTDEDYAADSSCGVGACKTNNTASICIGGEVTACQPGPSTPEVCNGIDDDCDGQTDEGLVTHTYYRDADNDTYGNADNATVACAAPEGYVDSLMADNTTIAFDCNDNAPTLTDNCTVCTDSDEDGYGENCAAGPDCDDSDASIHTGCNETPCILRVVPKQIFKLLAFLDPVIPFVISAQRDSGVVFARPFDIDWGTEAINDILRIRISKRIIVGFLFARPLQLEAGTFDVVVTYGDNQTEQCGTIEVK